MKVVVFLQNAWSPVYAGVIWPRDSWLRALWTSRSGKRLERLKMAAPDVDFWWDNTTAGVADKPNVALPPDVEHILSVLEVQKPTMVLTCGRQARLALLPLWQGAMVSIPHPAARVVTNTLFEVAAEQLRNTNCRVQLTQMRGSIVFRSVDD